jgi:Ca2+-binding RTX toxin-like protein
MYIEDCAFRVPGNPYSLNKNEGKFYEIGSPAGAAQLHAMNAAIITKFDYGKIDDNGNFQPHYTASELNPVSAIDFLNIFTTLPTDESYHKFVALFDGDTVAHGTKLGDVIETGAGDDKIYAKGGNDIAHRWDSGDLLYSGGDGFDTISFGTSYGSYFVKPKVQELVIDLETGLGDNPYGGKIKVNSVEKVIGTDAVDRIFGDNGRNWIETQDYGADLVEARGGKDTVVLWPFAFGATLDGGGGKDKLITAFEYLENTLDLTDQSKNTGKFEGGEIKNFEIFNFHSGSFDPATSLTFRAGAGSEAVIVSGRRMVTLELGDGDNKVKSGGGNDIITTGNGKDLIDGGGGGDILTGGGNADVFAFSLGHGNDEITDFGTDGKDRDRIDLTAITEIEDWNDLRNGHLSSAEGGARIDTSDGNSILLTDVDPDGLSAGNFLFA